MQWKSKTKRQERRLRKGVFLVSILLLSIALPVCRYGPRLYSRWEQHRLLAQARALLDAGDYRRSVLCLRQTLQLNPGNVEAVRIFADLADKTGKPDAVAFRERVSLLAPDSFDDAYAWATTALKYGDLAQAGEALAVLKRTGENREGYHEIAARIAVAARRPAEAKAEFSEALKLAPGDQPLQLEAAALDVQSNNAAVREAARQTLERLRKTPAQHTAALRALTAAYAFRGQLGPALPLARELATNSDASFEDRLIYLTILGSGRNPYFIAYLTGLQESVLNDPTRTAMLVSWLNTHGLAMMNSDWLATLPQDTVNKPPVAPETAETYILLAEWKKLKALTANPDWGDFEFMRLAYLSRALAQTGDSAGSDVQWKAAISAAADQPERLETLEKTAAAWRWDAKLEDLLWFIADNSKHPQQALETLANRYQHTGDTRKLYRAASGLLAHDPTNVALKNNWALLALLLHEDPDGALQAAQDLYNANSANPHIAATYAFALYMSNRTDDALDVMRKLPPEQLNIPSVAAYYGMMLAAIRSPEAGKYLDRAKEASLLPEEQKLLDKARRDIQEM